MSWLKVGKLAKRTGLTVRTLHYWEEIGLLSAGRTSSGHRIYGPDEVARLQHIVSLRALGFELGEISRLLDAEDWTLEVAIERQLEQVREEILRFRRLRDRLELAQQMVSAGGDWSVNVFLDAIEETVNVEKYYTEEQLEELAARAEALGEEGMLQAQRDWEALFAQVREMIDDGVEPGDPRVDPVLAEQQRLIAAFTGGNPEIRASLQELYDEEGPERASHGMMDSDIAEFLAAAHVLRS